MPVLMDIVSCCAVARPQDAIRARTLASEPSNLSTISDVEPCGSAEFAGDSSSHGVVSAQFSTQNSPFQTSGYHSMA